MESVKRFITQKLKLKVNEAKSAVAKPQERKFLGFSFTDGPIVRRCMAPKAITRFKERIREITRYARSVSMDTIMARLAPYMKGWSSYFGFCETPSTLVKLTSWVRRRRRCAIWQQWKTSRRRRAALIQLGVRPDLARDAASSGRGPWRMSRSTAWHIGLSNNYFRDRGFPSLAGPGSRN